MKRIYNRETKDYDLVPSENYGPNKYLVSDADGNPRWEDRYGYKTKPFEDIVWDGVTEGHETANLSGLTLVKVSDISLSEKDVVGATFVYGEETDERVVTSDDVVSTGDGFHINEVIIVMPEDGNFIGNPLTKGVWFMVEADLRALIWPEVVHPIPAELLSRYDAIIDCSYDALNAVDGGIENLSLVGATYTELVEKMRKGIPINILFRTLTFYGGDVWVMNPATYIVYNANYIDMRFKNYGSYGEFQIRLGQDGLVSISSAT